MNLATNIAGMAFVFIFLGLILIFSFTGRDKPRRNFRDIPAFKNLSRAIQLAVEDGSRLHISLGRGTISGTQSASAIVGMSMLNRITHVASDSDNPPITTSGDGSLAILSQDTMHNTYLNIGAEERYNPLAGRLVGLSPFSYAAGALANIYDEKVSASVLVGNFGIEVALITEASARTRTFTLAGSDNIPAQAILYATAEEPLIGEELFAGGAYMNAGPLHTASLRAQDAIRWLLIILILGGSILKFAL